MIKRNKDFIILTYQVRDFRQVLLGQGGREAGVGDQGGDSLVGSLETFIDLINSMVMKHILVTHILNIGRKLSFRS